MLPLEPYGLTFFLKMCKHASIAVLRLSLVPSTTPRVIFGQWLAWYESNPCCDMVVIECRHLSCSLETCSLSRRSRIRSARTTVRLLLLRLCAYLLRRSPRTDGRAAWPHPEGLCTERSHVEGFLHAHGRAAQHLRTQLLAPGKGAAHAFGPLASILTVHRCWRRSTSTARRMQQKLPRSSVRC